MSLNYLEIYPLLPIQILLGQVVENTDPHLDGLLGGFRLFFFLSSYDRQDFSRHATLLTIDIKGCISRDRIGRKGREGKARQGGEAISIDRKEKGLAGIF